MTGEERCLGILPVFPDYQIEPQCFMSYLPLKIIQSFSLLPPAAARPDVDIPDLQIDIADC